MCVGVFWQGSVVVTASSDLITAWWSRVWTGVDGVGSQLLIRSLRSCVRCAFRFQHQTKTYQGTPVESKQFCSSGAAKAAAGTMVVTVK